MELNLHIHLYYSFQNWQLLSIKNFINLHFFANHFKLFQLNKSELFIHFISIHIKKFHISRPDLIADEPVNLILCAYIISNCEGVNVCYLDNCGRLAIYTHVLMYAFIFLIMTLPCTNTTYYSQAGNSKQNDTSRKRSGFVLWKTYKCFLLLTLTYI